MGTSIFSTFLSASNKPTKPTNQQVEKWGRCLGAITLSSELIASFGGKKYQLPAAKRREVIATLKEIKIAEHQHRQLHDTENNNDEVLTDVALSGMLRKKNITPTAPRLVMMKILFQRKSHQHITAEEIFAKLKNKKKSGISLASIYNCLNLFAEHGLLARYHFSSFLLVHKKLSAVVYDTNIMPHHHVIDKLSGKIYDLPLEIIPLHQVVETAEKNIKKDTMVPKNLWRADGIKRNIFVMPMVFVLE